MWLDHMNSGNIIVAFLNVRCQPLCFLNILWTIKVIKCFPILLKMLLRVNFAFTYSSLNV